MSWTGKKRNQFDASLCEKTSLRSPKQWTLRFCMLRRVCTEKVFWCCLHWTLQLFSEQKQNNTNCFFWGIKKNKFWSKKAERFWNINSFSEWNLQQRQQPQKSWHEYIYQNIANQSEKKDKQFSTVSLQNWRQSIWRKTLFSEKSVAKSLTEQPLLPTISSTKLSQHFWELILW